MADPTGTPAPGGPGGPGGSVAQAEAAVQESREQLAATLGALHEKADVKARAGGWVAAHRPVLLGAAGTGAVLVTLLVVVRRRR